jgi:hypothetical protein
MRMTELSLYLLRRDESISTQAGSIISTTTDWILLVEYMSTLVGEYNIKQCAISTALIFLAITKTYTNSVY